MRIGFDASVLRHGVTNGTAVYAYHLVEALLSLDGAHQIVLYCGSRCGPSGREALERLRAMGARLVHGAAPWRWSPDAAWWLPVRAPVGSFLESIDVLHVGEFLLPPPGRVPCVATVHDVTPQLMPDVHMRLNLWLHRRRLLWIERFADRVIVVSKSTRDDLLRISDVPSDRVDLVYEARGRANAKNLGAKADSAPMSTSSLVAGGPYVLSVGTLEPRKNHVRLIHAFEGVVDRYPDLRLKLAGSWGWRSGPIRQAIESSRVRSRIDVLGRVSPQELGDLYAGALVFAFPSLYEGFGIPLLEAMAAGVPILTSNRSSMPEIVGDAAVQVDPTSVESIQSGLETLLSDERLRKILAERGRKREQEFSWTVAAQQTLETYQKAIAGWDRAPRGWSFQHDRWRGHVLRWSR